MKSMLGCLFALAMAVLCAMVGYNAFQGDISYLFDSLVLDSYRATLMLAGMNTVITVVLGFLTALAIHNTQRPLLWLSLILLPSFVPFILKTYAFMNIAQVFDVYQSVWLSLIVMVYNYLPFALLPCYVAISKMDHTLVQAGFDMGAGPFRVLTKIIVPATKKGWMTATSLVLLPSLGEYAINSLVGSPDHQMIAQSIFNEYFSNGNTINASMLSLTILVIVCVFVMKGKK